MARLVLLAISLFVALSYASDVVVLTDANFHDFIKTNPNVFVEFYAPWCGHCKNLAPDWEKAATALKGEVVIAKVDATVETKVATEMGVRGYPTLKFFQNGVPRDYQGQRSLDALTSYARKQTKPALSFFENKESVEEFAGKDKVSVVGFFSSKDSASFSAFQAVSNKLRDSFSFGAVIGSSVVDASAFGGSAGDAVILFKKFDDGKTIYTGEINENALSAWVNAESFALLDEIGPENYQRYMDTGLPLLYLFLDPTADNSAIKADFAAIAKTVRGKLNMIWIDNSKYGSQASRLALSGKTIPSVAIDGNGLHYVFDESKPVTAAAVGEWVNSFVENKLEPTIKSEEIPADNNGPVKILVAKNFDSIVLDSTKDVLVEFYAPWCGHCKKLTPIYDELGTKFTSTPSVVIAKIDATANDVDPKFGIKGFPTLKFFPANNKANPIPYEGDRSLADLERFVREKATTLEGLKDDL